MNTRRSGHLTTNAATRRARDPEFDETNPAAPSPPEDAVRFYQRLLVNPFLGAAGLFCTLMLCNLFASLNLPLLVIPAIGLGFVASTFLVHYHCLDCGTTGAFHGWRRHSCSAIRGRWNDRQRNAARSWFPYPAAPTQLALWLIIGSVALIFLGLIVSNGR